VACADLFVRLFLFTSIDLTKVSECEKIFSKAISEFGKVDIAINTVGKVIKKSILETTEQDYDSLFEVNTKSAFFFIKEAGKVLSKGGAILTVLTSLITAYTPFYSGYAGSKSAVEQFSKTASKEFSEKGITVSCVSPGPMNTDFFYAQETTQSINYCKNAAALSKFSKSGLTEVEDVGNFIRFLVTEGWWINGQNIMCNGGYTVK